MESFDLSIISLDGDLPMYTRLAEVFRHAIADGTLKEGDLLPAESELCRILKISRTTVRQTFALLESEGLVSRKRGKGTFVTVPKLRRSLNNLYSFTYEMRSMGLNPRSKVMSFTTVKPPTKVSKLLGLSSEEKVKKIVRLRIADDVPLILETAYIPQRFCQTISELDLSNDSLYAMITEYTGYPPSQAVESYDAIILDEKTAKALRCPPGSPAFHIQRVSSNSADQVFEVCYLIARGDKNTYEVTLRRNDIMFTRKITMSE